jgi:hypothetical protein
MGKVYPGIDGRLREFLLRQPVFFVATAPADGHVNVSPKGMSGTFAVLDKDRVAYLDYTGSGVETISHLRDNGRITLMFCAFSGPPNIVRLYGRGEVVLPEDPRFPEMFAHFARSDQGGSVAGSDQGGSVAGSDQHGSVAGSDQGGSVTPLSEHSVRSVIVVDVDRVSDSCGFAVPLMEHLGDRTLLQEWAARKTEDDLVAYRKDRNAMSIDGLPGLS